jgi:uracil-DNA glycosylase family 4
MQESGNDIGVMRAALEWYSAMGVDMALSDEPVDRFAAPASVQKTAPASMPSGAQTTTDAPAPTQTHMQPEVHNVEEAKALAAAATTLDALREAMDGFEGCPLKHRATNLVFAAGNPDADIMLVGEAPGREEDMQGAPFVGRSGELLDRILAAIGLNREKVFIANTLPWRPPGNRNPTPAETAVCLPFLVRQVELVAPKVIVTMGGAASKTLLKTEAGILRLRGKWKDIEVGEHSCTSIATLHPTYLLSQPAQKALVWRDMLSLRAKMATFE